MTSFYVELLGGQIAYEAIKGKSRHYFFLIIFFNGVCGRAFAGRTSIFADRSSSDSTCARDTKVCFHTHTPTQRKKEETIEKKWKEKERERVTRPL